MRLQPLFVAAPAGSAGRRHHPRAWLSWVRRALFTSVIAALLGASGALTGVAHADEVDLKANELRYQLFVGNERLNVRDNQFWIRGLEQMYLLDYRTRHPEATQAQLVERLAWYHARLQEEGLADDALRPAYAILSGGLQVLVDAGYDPNLSASASALKQIMDATMGAQVTTYGSVQDSIAGSWQTYGSMEKLNTVMDLLLRQVIMTADQDRTFGDARDQWFGALSRASVYNTAEQFLADPLLASWINTGAIIDLLQSGTVDREQFNQFVREEFAKLGVKLNQMRDSHLDVLIQNSTTYRLVENGQRGNAQVYADALVQAQQNEQVLEAARSGVYVLSTLAGFFDPRLSKQIGVLGNAAVQVATAINKYLPTVAGLGLGQALTSLSTVVLTGNLLGAVMSVLPLFVDSGPTADELILSQLQQLRQDVAQLGANMNDRFNRVERGMSQIYQDMMVEFDRVESLLGEIKTELNTIGRTLVTLQTRLDEIGQRLFAALEEIHLQDLKRQINYALGYQSRYNRVLSDDDFIRAENDFEFYAATVSRDSVATAPVAQSNRVNNLDIDPNLAGAELPRQLGYLTWLAKNRFGYGITPRTVPNPAVWSLAARAYARLIAENPAVARTITAQPQVRGTGAEIDALVRQLSQPTAAGSTNSLFTGLINNYTAETRNLSNLLRAEHNAVLNGRTVNLFADASQSVPVPADPTAIPRCDGTTQVSTPANMKPSTLPGVLHTAVAGYRGGATPPKLETCWKVIVYETETIEGPKVTYVYGAADMRVETRFRFSDSEAWQLVRSVQATVWAGRWCTQRTDIGGPLVCGDPTASIVNAWDSTHKATVQAAPATTDNDQVNAIAGRTTEHLRAEANRYLEAVTTKLSQEGPLKDVVKAQAGAATLLRAYTRIGFPLALDNDDLMSAMVIGDKAIVAETTDGPMVSRTYQEAKERFKLCPAGETTGCTPADRLYQVLWDQPYLTEGLAAPPGVTLPGEPVGDALISAALARAGVLQERIGVYSQQIAAGTHTESLPVFTEVAARLSLAESLIQFEPADSLAPARATGI